MLSVTLAEPAMFHDIETNRYLQVTFTQSSTILSRSLVTTQFVKCMTFLLHFVKCMTFNTGATVVSLIYLFLTLDCRINHYSNFEATHQLFRKRKEVKRQSIISIGKLVSDSINQSAKWLLNQPGELETCLEV